MADGHVEEDVRIRVLAFASYAEALGCGEHDVELPTGATVADCVAEIRTATGSGVPPAPLVAVNRRYARADRVLVEGDEVALIPPVAGG
jgi:molybdopterin converting factor subunit 1